MGWRLLVACTVSVVSQATAEVPERTFRSVGDVTYMPIENESSCGKEPRDLLRAATKRARVVTVTAQYIRVNDAQPVEIIERSVEMVAASRSVPTPTEAFPDRTTMMNTAVAQLGPDDFVFFLMRRVTGGNSSCVDVFRVSVE